MPGALRRVEFVKCIHGPRVARGALVEESVERTEALFGILRCDVKLHAIACGNDDRLADSVRRAEPLRLRAELVHCKHETLAQRDIGGVMAKAEAEDVHFTK